MSQPWFCAINGQSTGPHDDQQVRAMAASGKLRPQDLVWREGMADWAPVGSVPGLLPLMAAQLAAAPIGGIGPAGPVGPVGAAPRGPDVPFAQPAGMLSYATPTHLAPPPGTAGPVVPPDDGPFLRLGRVFGSSKGMWTGNAIASPRAIYLLKVSKQQQGAYAAGGLVGMMIASALDSGDDVRTCSTLDLPVPVRQQLDPKGKHAGKDVIILPREAASRVKVGAINNVVKVTCGGDKFPVHIGLFRNGGVRRFLTGNGWTINADVQPTLAPVHGHGFGRAWGEKPKGRSLATRILLIVLAIIIFIVVVALRMATER